MQYLPLEQLQGETPAPDVVTHGFEFLGQACPVSEVVFERQVARKGEDSADCTDAHSIR